jgi:hypothetical protein
MRFRGIRDLTAHREELTVVFPEKGMIALQAYRFVVDTVKIPEAMLNPAVADFALYGGLHVGLFLEFLDRVSEKVATALSLALPASAGGCSSSGSKWSAIG